MDIWESHSHISMDHICRIKITAWRCVEDQAKSYTRKLVSTDEEHRVLEELLDKKSKPQNLKDLKNQHYLLFTPFRYPPLKQGSRFGAKHEKSIFYASLDRNTSLAEKAFYRFAFMRSSTANLDGDMMNMTSFKVNIDTYQGLDLTKPPFSAYTDDISSKTQYTLSQLLGKKMRARNIEAFVFYSARTPINHPKGKNVGVISPTAFGENNDLEYSFVHWQCYITKQLIEFTPKFSKNVDALVFNVEDFFVDGVFPEIP